MFSKLVLTVKTGLGIGLLFGALYWGLVFGGQYQRAESAAYCQRLIEHGYVVRLEAGRCWASVGNGYYLSVFAMSGEPKELKP